jgi:hypothetical protein
VKALGVLVFALLVSAVAVITYPEWYQPVTRAAPSVTQWLPTPSESTALATGAPIVVTTLNPSATPVLLVTPPAAAASLPDWTIADCSWAEQTMTWDHALDAAEAQKIANGQDTRYGTGPALVQYYLNYADDWQTALGQITEVCTGTGFPSAAENAATVQAFTTAIAAHRADVASKAPHSDFQRLWYDVEGFFEAGNGWAIDWDNQWIGSYQRLTTMFSELPSS